jgi:glutamyl-tRNA reductase
VSLYLIGIDYRRADIWLREEILRKRSEISGYFPKAAVFSTCNRFEIYGIGSLAHNLPKELRSAYIFEAEPDIYRHMLRLALGLESQIKAETQIVEQLSEWLEREDIPTKLKDMWRSALLASVDIRRDSGLGSKERNIADFIFGKIKKLLSAFKEQEIIIVGTGKVAQLFSRYRSEGMRLSFVSHKHRAQAEALAKNSGGRVISLPEFKEAVLEAEVLIGASSSPHYIFRKEDIARMTAGRLKPLYIFDLALPRDFEPAAKVVKAVCLYNCEDLAQEIQEYNSAIEENIRLAEFLVEEQVNPVRKDGALDPAFSNKVFKFLSTSSPP